MVFFYATDTDVLSTFPSHGWFDAASNPELAEVPKSRFPDQRKCPAGAVMGGGSGRGMVRKKSPNPLCSIHDHDPVSCSIHFDPLVFNKKETIFMTMIHFERPTSVTGEEPTPILMIFGMNPPTPPWGWPLWNACPEAFQPYDCRRASASYAKRVVAPTSVSISPSVCGTRQLGMDQYLWKYHF